MSDGNPIQSENKRLLICISQEIQDGEHIFLDASTTAVFIAKNIKNKKKLTVITNSIENLLELSDISEWDIISTGGMLKGDSMSFLGVKAADSIEQYMQRCFSPAKGWISKKGLQKAMMKQGVLNRA